MAWIAISVLSVASDAQDWGNEEHNDKFSLRTVQGILEQILPEIIVL